ncbi:MAG: tRNA lysidine(34) synthetase TilS [Acidobacteriota bacterium]|nr:tRNA lysidine(34) synthetase TilS [Acidobacteriota bacterium]
MIYQRVKKFIEANRLFSPESRLLVAVSGGQDSVALVHLLIELREDWPELEIALAHFNHQLRKSALADEKFVKQLGQRLGLKVMVGRAEVREYARQEKLNLENAGRLLRYQYLKKTAEKWGAEHILTAHTMTDQAETVLMKIFRGTGLEGLQGIRVRAGLVVRPLLCLSRREIEVYIRENNFEFRTDETNLDLEILRNKIRLELIPYLEAEFDPEIVSHLSQLALIAQDENEALAELAEGLWPVVTKKGGHTSVSPFLRSLKEMPVAVARRLVRKFLKVSLGLESPSFDQTQAVLELKEGQKFSWGQQKVLINEGGWLKRCETKKMQPGYKLLWDGKQNLRVSDCWEFQGKLVSAKKLGQPEYDDARRCYLDAEKLKFPLEVRSRRPGDRYRPLGMSGEKKLKELMSERKIPREERDLLPLFISDNQIVWSLGLPVSEVFRISSETRRVFVIEYVSPEEA